MSRMQLIAFVKSVMASGADKPELETTKPKLSEIAARVASCDTAFEEESLAEIHCQALRTESEMLVEALRKDFTEFTQSVDSLYKGDVAKLQATGLGIRNPPTPVGPLPAPANVRSRIGALPGTTVILWNTVRGRYVFEVEYASTQDGPWTRCYQGTALRHECEGLTSGAEYWFRVRAIGKAGPSPWSEMTRRRAA